MQNLRDRIESQITPALKSLTQAFLQNQKATAAAQFQAQKAEGIIKDIVDQYAQLAHWDALMSSDEVANNESPNIDIYGRK